MDKLKLKYSVIIEREIYLRRSPSSQKNIYVSMIQLNVVLCCHLLSGNYSHTLGIFLWSKFPYGVVDQITNYM